MKDQNILLLKRKQKRERNLEQKEKHLRQKYEKVKTQFDQETKDSKSEAFYKSLFQKEKEPAGKEKPSVPKEPKKEAKKVPKKQRVFKLSKKGQPLMKFQIQNHLQQIMRKYQTRN